MRRPFWETVTKRRITDFVFARQATEYGFFEHGRCATEHGYVAVFRQSNTLLTKKSNCTVLQFVAHGKIFTRDFDRFLTDRAVKMQANRLADRGANGTKLERERRESYAKEVLCRADPTLRPTSRTWRRV